MPFTLQTNLFEHLILLKYHTLLNILYRRCHTKKSLKKSLEKSFQGRIFLLFEGILEGIIDDRQQLRG